MVKIDNLYVKVGNFQLKGINLRVEKGQYCTILGPTGSGKTLLLESIAGLITSEKGRIFLNGKDVSKAPPEKRNIGYLPQDYALFPFMDVRKNIAIGLKLRGISEHVMEERIGEISFELNIGHLLDRMPDSLSGGEKQRVALARALIIDPEVLLLDEPYSSIDTNLKHSLWWFIKRLHRRIGKTIVHITHDLEEARILSDKVGIIADGRLIQEGSSDEVFGRPRTVKAARVVGINNIFAGELVAVEKGSLLLKWGDRRINLAIGENDSISGLKPGSRVKFSIRAEEIEIMGTEKSGNVFQPGKENSVKSVVTEYVPYGLGYILYCNIVGNADNDRCMKGWNKHDYDFEIRMSKERFNGINLSPDSTVTAYFPPQRLFLLNDE